MVFDDTRESVFDLLHLSWVWTPTDCKSFIRKNFFAFFSLLRYF